MPDNDRFRESGEVTVRHALTDPADNPCAVGFVQSGLFPGHPDQVTKGPVSHASVIAITRTMSRTGARPKNSSTPPRIGLTSRLGHQV